MRISNTIFLPLALGALYTLTGCGKTVSTTANLLNGTGQMVGSVMFSQSGDDPVQVEISVTGLTPGQHGVHVHDVGKCDPPDFMSAGGHFNPTGAMHGAPESAAHHFGDLGNLDVGADGSGTLKQASHVLSLKSDNPGYVANRAFIVHASPDDLATQPTGNAGGRVACGVIPAPGN